MSQRQLHDQVRRGFSALTRPPRPQLDERIRESLWARSAAAAAPPSRLPVIAVAVVLLALVAIAAVLAGPAAVGAAGRAGSGLASVASGLLTPPRSAGRPASPPAASPTPAPASSPTPNPSETPTEPPTATPPPVATPAPVLPAPAPPPLPPAATLPGYSCAAQSGGGGQAAMSTARTGSQVGYDRFVIQFDGPVPQYQVTPQGSASFGGTTLEGSSGLAVVLHDASSPSYAGPTVIKPGLSQIREVRLLGESGGVVEWGVGIARPACFLAWTLPGPSRLVIDIAK